MSSRVTIRGALQPLREGQAKQEAYNEYEIHYYVGGQTERSFDVAWSIIDRHMDEYLASPPIRCASARFGNCLHVHLVKGPAVWILRFRGHGIWNL